MIKFLFKNIIEPVYRKWQCYKAYYIAVKNADVIAPCAKCGVKYLWNDLGNEGVKPEQRICDACREKPCDCASCIRNREHDKG